MFGRLTMWAIYLSKHVNEHYKINQQDLEKAYCRVSDNILSKSLEKKIFRIVYIWDVQYI